jgi:hypothetical protein
MRAARPAATAASICLRTLAEAPHNGSLVTISAK